MPTLLIIGLVLGVIGELMLLRVIFRNSALKGIFYLLLPPLQIIFVVFHWRQAWRPVCIMMAGIILVILSLLTVPDIGGQQSGASPFPALEHSWQKAQSLASAGRGQKTLYKCQDKQGHIAYIDKATCNGKVLKTIVVQDSSATFSPALPSVTATSFKCDGRRYCGQMTSCQEARLFLQHCPDVEMDDDGNGVPCEKQWCQF